MKSRDAISEGTSVVAPHGVKNGPPWWLSLWTALVVAWALGWVFVGARDPFGIGDPVNIVFAVVIALWAVYQFFAPLLRLPPLPLG